MWIQLAIRASSWSAVAAKRPRICILWPTGDTRFARSFDQCVMQLFKFKYVSLEKGGYYAKIWNRVEMEMHGFTTSSGGLRKRDAERGIAGWTGAESILCIY